MTTATGATRDVRHSAVLLVGTGVTAALTFGFLSLAANELGPSATGELFAGVYLLFFVHTLFGPVNTAVARLTAIGDDDPGAVLRQALTLTARVVLPVAALAAISLPWQADALGADVNVLAAAWLTALLVAPATVIRGSLRGRSAFGALVTNQVGEAAVRFAVGAGLLFAAARADLAMAAYVVGIGAALVHLHMVRRGEAASAVSATKTPDSRLASVIAPLLLLASADAASQNLDVLFVQHRFGDHDAGIYGAAATVSRVLGVLVTPFVIQIVPLLAGRGARNEAAGRPIAMMVGGFVALSIGVLLLLASAGGALVGALFGAGFSATADLVVPHALGSLLGYAAVVLAQGLAAVGQLGFVRIYALAAVAQMVMYFAAGHSTYEVAVVTLVGKACSLAAVAFAWLIHHRNTRATLR